MVRSRLKGMDGFPAETIAQFFRKGILGNIPCFPVLQNLLADFFFVLLFLRCIAFHSHASNHMLSYAVCAGFRETPDGQSVSMPGCLDWLIACIFAFVEIPFSRPE